MHLTPLQEFIWQHREDDPRHLALSAKKYPNIPVAEAAAQVQALQKVRSKMPDWYRAGMSFPLAVSLEQASSEPTARFKAGLFVGKRVLDLTGGLGLDSFFFSQQFETLTYVEHNAELLAAAKHNFAQLGVSNVQFEHSSAEDFLQRTTEHFDLIYLDPARRSEQKGRVFQLADCSPDVLKLQARMLELSPKVLLKTAPLLDIRLAASQLKQVTKIWVLTSDGDCREVLYLLERQAAKLDEIPIEARVLGEAGSVFGFSWAEEQQVGAPFSEPQRYLYEPNPSILKAGAFRSFAHRFGLSKLHPNTHVYTSNELAAGVPARLFVVQAICKYERKAVQAALPAAKANVTCRNFPDNPDQVRKKLGLADGGDTYLFAVTDAENRKTILVCQKV